MFCVIFLWSRYTFIHFLSYLDEPINSVHPSASSCFLLFFYFSFPHIKNARKIPGKIQEKSAYRKLPEEPGRGQRGAKGGPGGKPARRHPFRLFILRHGKTPEEEPY